VGEFLARLNLALAGFSHPAAGHFMPWDSTNGLIFRPQLLDLLPVEVGGLAVPILHCLETRTFPALKRLSCQVIHPDGLCATCCVIRPIPATARRDRFRGHGLWPADRDLAVAAALIEKATAPAEAAAALRGFRVNRYRERNRAGFDDGPPNPLAIK
jgi:hypothetical protein